MNTRRVAITAALAAAWSLGARAQDSIKVRWDSYAPEVLPSDSLAMQWNHEFLVAIRVIAPPPTVSARHLAILHTAIYNVWAAYDDKAMDTQLGSTLRRPAAERTDANRARAISYAAYLAAVDQFPTLTDQFQRFMRRLGYDPTRLPADPRRPEGVALRSVQALLRYRHQDGANQLGDLNAKGLYTDPTGFKVYRPGTAEPVNLALWQPLTTGNGMGGFNDIDNHLKKIRAVPRQRVTVELNGFNQQRYVTPHWGNVLPFAMDNGAHFSVAPPLPLTDADRSAAANEDNNTYADLDGLGDDQYPTSFRQQARQLLRYSARLTDREKSITTYWADGPLSESPPGHWNVLSHYISRLNKQGLADDVKMFFVLNNALLDASIAAWHTKRVYNYVRPVTVIRTLFADLPVKAWAGPVDGVKQITGAQWWPYQEKYFVTPAFPEHVSGHSTFSYAAATALRLFRGSDGFGAFAVVRRGSSAVEIGRGPREDITLRWDSLSAAAREASLSRRYGGLHFAHGDLEGRALGMKVGEAVWRSAVDCIEGRGAPMARSYRNLYADAR
jgi:membrane-associated phospholipid phosphatase